MHARGGSVCRLPRAHHRWPAAAAALTGGSANLPGAAILIVGVVRGLLRLLDRALAPGLLLQQAARQRGARLGQACGQAGGTGAGRERARECRVRWRPGPVTGGAMACVSTAGACPAADLGLISGRGAIRAARGADRPPLTRRGAPGQSPVGQRIAGSGQSADPARYGPEAGEGQRASAETRGSERS